MADDTMCATWCNACSTGDQDACLGVTMNPQCKRACPPWLRNMGQAFDDPLESTLEGFKADKSYWEEPEDHGADRDTRSLLYASAKAAGREAMAPVQFTNREDVWGGGLRRMTSGGVGPRREDEHYYAPRYTPVGFARYVDPTIDPADYTYYLLSGWRVAVPRTVPGPAIRALLLRIYQYGPGAVGYARLGDTLVPAILGPGDRQTLAESESRYGPASRKYPLA
jgi:hypothetical protein